MIPGETHSSVPATTRKTEKSQVNQYIQMQVQFQSQVQDQDNVRACLAITGCRYPTCGMRVYRKKHYMHVLQQDRPYVMDHSILLTPVGATERLGMSGSCECIKCLLRGLLHPESNAEWRLTEGSILP